MSEEKDIHYTHPASPFIYKNTPTPTSPLPSPILDS